MDGSAAYGRFILGGCSGMSDNNVKYEKKPFNVLPLDILDILLTVYMLISVFLLFTPCDGIAGKHVCHTAGLAVAIVSAVNTVFALVKVIIKSLAVKRILAILTAIISLFIIIAPGTIFPLCSEHSMICITSFKPGTVAVAAVTLTVAVIEIIVTVLKEKGK